MLDLIRSAVAALQTTRKASLSEPVTYQRNAETIASLAATRGQNEFELDSGLLVRLENDQQDWIITAADLFFSPGASPVLPERGDRLIDAAGVNFEVQSLDGQKQPYNLDQTGQQLRITTKRV
jgi:hypothetical protein